eukprot:TRINITY_DN1793_c0_g1_i3.p1 TRINITY_DN1793_c0_g1~~TRINITY_DN1793_c0_g1_i3.p1  ORF type:complete len:363 (+),score=67.16 TRINITY_DN1793_c0_g1_i3:60-1148(+)
MDIFVSVESGDIIPVNVTLKDKVKDVLEKASLDPDTTISYEGDPLKPSDNVLSKGVSGGDTLQAVASEKLRARRLLQSKYRIQGPSSTKVVQAIINNQTDLLHLLIDAEYNGESNEYAGHLVTTSLDTCGILLQRLPWSDRQLECALTTALIKKTEFPRCKLFLEHGAGCRMTPTLLSANDDQLIHVIRSGAAQFSTEFVFSCLRNRPTVAKAILKQAPGFLRECDEFGNYAVHIAADAKFGSESTNLDLLQAIMEADADPEELLSAHTSLGRWTPIHVAVFSDKPLIVDYLIEKGSPIDPVKDYKFTPLHLAAGHSSPDIIQALLKAGASLSSKDKLGRTPYEVAVSMERHDAAKMLDSLG